MRPRLPLISACVLALLGPKAVRADVFDQYTNRDLANAIGVGGIVPVTAIPAKRLAQVGGAVPGTQAALLIVKTAEGRWAKVLVQPAKQKYADGAEPILLIERFVTFKEGTDRAVHSSGQNVQMYPGFHFSLDLGQVVPPKLSGDLTMAADAGSLELRPVGAAKLYLAEKLPPASAPPKGARPTIGEAFEIRYFNGSYRLYDDGRRSGTLTLRVDDAGDVTGSFYSDKDGRKYDVKGKVGTPRHAVEFAIKYPQTAETFQGFLFTGDGKAMAGTSKLQDREAGFYAVRTDD